MGSSLVDLAFLLLTRSSHDCPCHRCRVDALVTSVVQFCTSETVQARVLDVIARRYVTLHASSKRIPQHQAAEWPYCFQHLCQFLRRSLVYPAKFLLDAACGAMETARQGALLAIVAAAAR